MSALGDDDDDLYGDLFDAKPHVPNAVVQPLNNAAAVCGLSRDETSAEQPEPMTAGVSVAQVFHDHDLKELRSELAISKTQLDECQQLLLGSQQRCAQLEAERMVLVRNISVLYKTATLEVERKATEIRSLRQVQQRAAAALVTVPQGLVPTAMAAGGGLLAGHALSSLQAASGQASRAPMHALHPEQQSGNHRSSADPCAARVSNVASRPTRACEDQPNGKRRREDVVRSDVENRDAPRQSQQQDRRMDLEATKLGSRREGSTGGSSHRVSSRSSGQGDGGRGALKCQGGKHEYGSDRSAGARNEHLGSWGKPSSRDAPSRADYR